MSEFTEAVLAGATVALVIATGALAWFTKALMRVTGQLRELEVQRDAREVRRRKYHRVATKLSLAEKIIATPLDDFTPTGASDLARGERVYLGGRPREAAAWLRRIARILDYGKDQVLKATIDKVLLALDNLGPGMRLGADVAKGNLLDPLKQVQERLAWDLFKWREELDELGGREDVPPET